MTDWRWSEVRRFAGTNICPATNQKMKWILNRNKKPTNWWGRQNAAPLKFDRRQAAFSAVFSNFEKCRPDAADDPMSGLAAEYVGLDVLVKFGDSMLNTFRPHPFYPRLYSIYLFTFCTRPEPASDVISSRFVGANCTRQARKISWSSLKSFWRNSTKNRRIGYGIFGRFSNFDKWQPEVTSDVIYGVALVYVDVDVGAKLGDSRLNSGRTILHKVNGFYNSRMIWHES